MTASATRRELAKAPTWGGGNNINDGRYRFLVENFIEHVGGSPPQTTYVLELRTMESAAVEIPGLEKQPVPNAVGSSVSCAWNTGKHQSAMSNAKAAIFGILGVDPKTITEDETNEILDDVIDNNSLRGMIVDVETYRKLNQGKTNPQNRGMPMTFPKWIHVAGQDEESIAKGRATLDTVKSRTERAVDNKPEMANPPPAPAQAAAPAPTPTPTKPATGAARFLTRK